MRDQTHKDILRGMGITGLLVTCSVYLPLFGFISSILIPLPVLAYRLKLGRYQGAVIPLAVFIMIWAVMGGLSLSLLFFGELMFLGLILGEIMDRRLPLEIIFLYAGIAVLLTTLAVLIAYGLVTHQSPMDMVSAHVGKNLEMTLALYKQQGIADNSLLMIENSLDRIQYVLVRILPGLVSSALLFTIWINVLATRGIARRQGIHFPDFGNLNHWKASEYLVWVVIGCGVMLLSDSQGLNLLGLNGLLVLMSIYFFQGIAIVSFYLEKRNFSPGVKFFCYGLIFLQQLLLLIVIGIGLFDTWMNFRKLEPNQKL